VKKKSRVEVEVEGVRVVGRSKVKYSKGVVKVVVEVVGK
jgi:hypothetical protein